MKIMIIAPTLNTHGGVRVLVEWANTLSAKGHDLTLQVESGTISPHWITINKDVTVRGGSMWQHSIAEFDVIVAGTPAIALRLDNVPAKGKKFFLLQMAEDMFMPNNPGYVKMCQDSYSVKMPIIGISNWVEAHVRKWRGSNTMFYVGNGVSDHFKPGKKSRFPTIMVEGWNGYNAAKDVDKLTARAASKLKSEFPKIKIIGYGNQHPQGYTDCISRYEVNASTEQIRDMYQESWMLIKATRFDARSCVPVEAMKCGTPTARALVKGDDDLIDGYNCLRVEYNFDAFYEICKKLYLEEDLRKELGENGLKYSKTNLDWDYWMDRVLNIFEL